MNTSGLKTILYVDDEADIRDIVEMSLAMVENVSVHTCASGEQALQFLTQTRPDLILLDVMMPGMDGPMTLENIRNRAELAHVPVVFMTAKAAPTEVARLKRLGAIGVIPKPFDPVELPTQLGLIWSEHEKASSAEPMARRLAEVAVRYLQRTKDEINQLRQRISGIMPIDATTLNDMRHLAHRMHGSAAVLGLKGISAAAGALEAAIEHGTPAAPDREVAFLAQLHVLLDRLESEVKYGTP
jgi:two-component system OmpR family response regulator